MPQVRSRPSSDDVHEVAFFRRYSHDDPGQAVPGREFLNACPGKVPGQALRAVLGRDMLLSIRPRRPDSKG